MIDEPIAQQLARSGHFYVMHRFDLDNVAFARRMRDAAVMRSRATAAVVVVITRSAAPSPPCHRSGSDAAGSDALAGPGQAAATVPARRARVPDAASPGLRLPPPLSGRRAEMRARDPGFDPRGRRA